MWHARSKPVRIFSHQVVVKPILEWAKNDDGSGELEIDLFNGLVRQNRDGSRQVLTASETKSEKYKVCFHFYREFNNFKFKPV